MSPNKCSRCPRTVHARERGPIERVSGFVYCLNHCFTHLVARRALFFPLPRAGEGPIEREPGSSFAHAVAGALLQSSRGFLPLPRAGEGRGEGNGRRGPDQLNQQKTSTRCSPVPPVEPAAKDRPAHRRNLPASIRVCVPAQPVPTDARTRRVHR